MWEGVGLRVPVHVGEVVICVPVAVTVGVRDAVTEGVCEEESELDLERELVVLGEERVVTVGMPPSSA